MVRLDWNDQTDNFNPVKVLEQIFPEGTKQYYTKNDESKLKLFVVFLLFSAVIDRRAANFEKYKNYSIVKKGNLLVIIIVDLWHGHI